ncbi:MAG: hypothetical protein H8D56_04155 [Planctomycetes bacterium]|nr:hypothetical protein [Planctomycetota bacterium]MBL7145083.1 hypothetical protein [Phycisphaerae bacterium]
MENLEWRKVVDPSALLRTSFCWFLVFFFSFLAFFVENVVDVVGLGKMSNYSQKGILSGGKAGGMKAVVIMRLTGVKGSLLGRGISARWYSRHPPLKLL